MVSRAMTIEIREGARRRAEEGPHLPAPRPPRPQAAARAPARHLRDRRRIFAGVDVTKQPIPVAPTVHYNMGGMPTNYHGEAVTKAGDDPDAVLPGLMAVGEAACVSVHGSNRLGSNSLMRPRGVRPRRRPALRREAEGRRNPARAQARLDRPATSPASTACATPPAARRRPSCAWRCRRRCRRTRRCSAPARR